jgi:hypothetical protein
VVKPNSTVPGGFFSDAGCNPRVVSPVTSSLQPGGFKLQGQAEGVAIELHGAIHIADEFDDVAEFHWARLLGPEDIVPQLGMQ